MKTIHFDPVSVHSTIEVDRLREYLLSRLPLKVDPVDAFDRIKERLIARSKELESSTGQPLPMLERRLEDTDRKRESYGSRGEVITIISKNDTSVEIVVGPRHGDMRSENDLILNQICELLTELTDIKIRPF